MLLTLSPDLMSFAIPFGVFCFPSSYLLYNQKASFINKKDVIHNPERGKRRWLNSIATR